MGFSSVCRVTLSQYECPQSGEDGVPMAAIQESYLFCGKIVVRERDQVKVSYHDCFKVHFSFIRLTLIEKSGL